MSNETPPRARLADFGFLTAVHNPDHELACGANFEDGTNAFMSPELLVPSRYGIRDSIPTPEADIYAFGMVTFQVCDLDLRCRPFLLTSPRSLQANPHSAVSGLRSWDGLWFKGYAQPNQRTPHPLGFPICCGVSSSAAGMATQN